MNLSITEAKQFMFCPYQYRFRYKDNTPLLEIKATDHYYNCLRSVIIDMLKSTLAHGTLTPLDQVQKLWNKAWFIDPMALKFNKHMDRHKMGVNGWLVLNNFYFMIEPVISNLVSVDQSYSLPLRNTRNHITGTIDILMRKSYGGYQAVKLVNSEYYTGYMVGHNDIEMTAYRRAIMDITSQEPDLAYYVLEHTTKDLVPTKRYNAQDEVLDETALSIVKSIDQELYYPNFGRRCASCDYLPICDKGKWIDSTSLYSWHK